MVNFQYLRVISVQWVTLIKIKVERIILHYVYIEKRNFLYIDNVGATTEWRTLVLQYTYTYVVDLLLPLCSPPSHHYGSTNKTYFFLSLLAILPTNYRRPMMKG